jgi:iron complex transport system substrate-binding protein
MRVVSLVPSLTETLFALGAGEAVVGITNFCIFPEGIDRPRVGGTKTPNIARIRQLAPDIVYVNVEENLKKHAEEIAKFARVVATEPKKIDDVAKLIEMLGANHGCEARAAELVAQVTGNRQPATAFTFAVPIWKKPWMWCGGDTYVSNLIECAGGHNVLADEKRYPSRDPRQIEADVIFLPDEPYLFTADDAKGFKTRVIGPFPGHLFTWHGTRTILGLRFLRELFLE